jgi:hypothetical protein
MNFRTSPIKSEFNQLKASTKKIYDQVNAPNTEKDIKDQHFSSLEVTYFFHIMININLNLSFNHNSNVIKK